VDGIAGGAFVEEDRDLPSQGRPRSDLLEGAEYEGMVGYQEVHPLEAVDQGKLEVQGHEDSVAGEGEIPHLESRMVPFLR
jgi:hypothetical protein